MLSDSQLINPEDDFLGRYPFAQSLLNSLVSSHTSGQDCIVIGLTGAWGSGKSSLLEFIKFEINAKLKNKNERNLIVEFNPWRFTGEDDLLLKFYKDIGLKLGNYSNQVDALRRDTRKIAESVEALSSLNPDPVASKTSKALSKLFLKFTNEKSLEVFKKEINVRLADNNIKLYIFIDDLDRLLPSEISLMMKIIKLNADFKNTFIFLAYDKKIVAEAIGRQFQIDGSVFIEKIVTIDYSIPQINSEKLNKYFEVELSDFLKKHSIDFDLSELKGPFKKSIHSFFLSIREVKRFINAIELRLPIIKDEINISDFLSIETIRLFDYDAYKFIYENRYSFLYARNNQDNRFSTNEKVDWRSKLKDICINKNTIDLIEEIFSSNGRSDKELLRTKSIGHHKYFNSYFTFIIDSDTIPEKFYKDFLNIQDKEQRTNILGKILEINGFPNLWDRLIADENKITSQQKVNILNDTIDFIDSNNIEWNGPMPDSFSPFDTVSFAVEPFLSRPSDTELFVESLLASLSTGFYRVFILAYLYDKVKNPQMAINRFNGLGETNIVKENGELIISQYKSRLSSITQHWFNELKKHQRFSLRFLIRPFSVLNPEIYENLIKRALEKPVDAMSMFILSITDEHHSNLGACFSWRSERFIPKMTKEKIIPVLSKIKEEELPDEFKYFLKLFQIMQKDGFIEGKAYNEKFESSDVIF